MADKKKKNSIKEQRDRFLAFSFASADLFLEVGEDGYVSFALGAAKSLTGVDHNKLLGQFWLDIFSEGDKPHLSSMYKKAKIAQRCGPVQVLLDEVLGGGKVAIITGIKMPGSEKFYITIGFVSEMLLKFSKALEEKNYAESLEKPQYTDEKEENFAEKIGKPRYQDDKEENFAENYNKPDYADEEKGYAALLDKPKFIEVAEEIYNFGRTETKKEIDITLFDIPDYKGMKKKFGEETWDQFTETLNEILMSNAIDGQAAAQISDGRYSLIHDASLDSDALREQIIDLSKETDPDGEGFTIESKTISADLETLSERETSKALLYTINEFERKGTSLNINNLNSSFKAYVSANAQKIQQLKSMIGQLNFDLTFQPIASIDKHELSHYEILSRFKDKGSTQEWIIFAEDVGMAADFDIAVCERVINYIMYKASTNRFKFAMNLSGQSIQNNQFFKTLMAKLTINKDIAQRLIFEITESNTITELEKVNHFIKELQQEGFKVCLDDFGAGSASFQYIQQLHVDYVKIHGQYARKIISSQRDQLLIKNLAQLCRDLKIVTITEQVETEEQLEMMKSLGVQMAQGYYFGYPQKTPQFDPSALPAKPPR